MSESMNSKTSSYKSLLVLLLITSVICVEAHTNLAYPQSYYPASCHNPNCRGPLPPMLSSGKFRARNSEKNPAEVWRRGQTVNIKYHRNNHGGGFVRMALVPLSKKLDKKWHEYTAFHYGCFESGQYKCRGSNECGADVSGHGYSQRVTIPPVFPDGNYLFMLVWFGGLRNTRTVSRYSDYHAASHVRIRGGDRVETWYKPEFKAMPSPFKYGPKVPKGKCISSSLWVGECGGEECPRRPIMTVPGTFRDGRKPDSINANKIRKAL